MIKRVLKIWFFLLNTVTFLTLTIVIVKFIWGYLGIEYIYGSVPIGGDYFNGLTYQIHFSKFLPIPPSGWLPFWNEGLPVIGGYPFISFYLTHLLSNFYNTVTAINIFSIASLILFFVSSLILFWQVSKNWFIAISAVAALFATRATYYQLTAGGFIVSASAQWYLPIVLLFIYKFHQNQNWRYLILASIFSGVSILHHSATSLLMIFAPAFLILMLLQQSEKKLKKSIIYLALFTTVSISVGSIGIYATYLQNFLGAGTDACASEQCWGIYPKHLMVWLTPIPLVMSFVFIPFALIIKIFKRSTNLSFIVPAAAGLAVFLLYTLAAYFKLINGIANVIPPTRTFWAANFFVILVATSAFGLIQKALFWIAYPLSILVVGITLFFANNHLPDIYKERPNTVPYDVASYTTIPYKTKDISQIVPIWVSPDDPNWRVDILNQGITQWWNVVASTPQVRGYSNNPLGVHRDWQYFLQSATRDVPKETNPELVQNRALFLLDAFGIQFIENSLGVYPETITENPNFIKNKDIDFYVSTTRLLKNLQWYQLMPEISTPIVSPTSSPPVLFIGDEKGYEHFIRSIAMTNLNSKIFIPVKGPRSLNKVTKKELAFFPALILYQYQKSDFAKLTSYVKGGGNVFIETGSLPNIGKLPEIFPVGSAEENEAISSNNWQSDSDDILKGIDLQKFSSLTFKEGKWRFLSAKQNSVKPWAKVLLSHNNLPVIVGGKLEAGFVIWSGINLPFHIVNNNNLDEAKLFKNIMTKLINPGLENNATFAIERPKPEVLNVRGNNFRGIYFKESFDTGWQAKINKEKVKIYKAGLEFMYIPTNMDLDTEIDASIQYRGNISTWGLFFLTIISFAISTIFVILPNKFISIIIEKKTQIVGKFSKSVFKLTEDEL